MRKKGAFAYVLLSLLVLCTVVYQSVHSFTHVLEEVSTSTKNQDAHHASDAKHCYVCDFAFSPYVTPTISFITFFVALLITARYLFINRSVRVAAFFDVALRAPPMFFRLT